MESPKRHQPVGSSTCSNSPVSPRSSYISLDTPETPKPLCKSEFSPTASSPQLRASLRSIASTPSPIPDLPPLVFPLSGAPKSLIGLPTTEEYTAMQRDYLSDLSWTKRDKALIATKTYVDILHVLRDTSSTEVGSAQFRFWARNAFQLQRSTSNEDRSEDIQRSWVALHQGKRVALREELYHILCEGHQRCGHGGRDVTAKEIRKTWRFVPKDLVARFVRVCPTCTAKKMPGGVSSPGKSTIYSSDDDIGMGNLDSEDDYDEELQAPATPRALTRVQNTTPKSNDIEGLPLRTTESMTPFHSIPRLLISPVSEFPTFFTYGDNASAPGSVSHTSSPASGTSTPFSVLFSNTPTSSGKTTPSETDIDIPLGWDTFELLTDSKPKRRTQPRITMPQSATIKMSKHPSSYDLRQIMKQPRGPQRPIVRARSMEAFGATERDVTPLDPALAFYPAPHPPILLASDIQGNTDLGGKVVDWHAPKRPAMQRPGPINIQIANAPFLICSRTSFEHRGSTALSPSWRPSHSKVSKVSHGPGVSYTTNTSSHKFEEDTGTPGLSRTSTSTESSEVDSVPPTPCSAASVWSQDSAPNSAIFWDVNAREYADTAGGDDTRESAIARLLKEPSAFGMLTLDNHGDSEDHDSKLPVSPTRGKYPANYHRRGDIEMKSSGNDEELNLDNRDSGSEEGNSDIPDDG